MGSHPVRTATVPNYRDNLAEVRYCHGCGTLGYAYGQKNPVDWSGLSLYFHFKSFVVDFRKEYLSPKKHKSAREIIEAVNQLQSGPSLRQLPKNLFVLIQINANQTTTHRIVPMTTESASSMTLSNLEIRKISSECFASCLNMTQLDLSRNKIEKLPGKAFKGLVNLLQLNLNFNKIDAIDGDLFQDVGNLRELYMENNEIQRIDSMAFGKLKHLRNLNLSRNKLKSINQDLFFACEKLANLQLNGNEIESIHVEAFKSHHLLTRLDLSKNQLVELDFEVINQLFCLK